MPFRPGLRAGDAGHSSLTGEPATTVTRTHMRESVGREEWIACRHDEFPALSQDIRTGHRSPGARGPALSGSVGSEAGRTAILLWCHT